MAKIAIIRISGQAHLRPQQKDGLASLKLDHKFSFVVRDDSPTLRGMLASLKDLITWGPLDSELEPKLAGKTSLPPPRGGFGTRGTKLSYHAGGALGDRGEKINDMLKRMV